MGKLICKGGLPIDAIKMLIKASVPGCRYTDGYTASEHPIKEVYFMRLTRSVPAAALERTGNSRVYTKHRSVGEGEDLMPCLL